MPDGYDKDRERFENNRRGRIFEHGADRFFRDREKGFVRRSEKFRAAGKSIQFDKVRRDDQGKTFTVEEKSGRIEGPKDEKQLRVLRALLDRGEIEHHLLRSVQGETVSGACRELINDLVRDFPDRFSHQVISRTEARQIWALGLQREPGQQLELPGVGEHARQQTDRQREARQQQRTRDDRARAERGTGRQQELGPDLERLNSDRESVDLKESDAEQKRQRDTAEAASRAEKVWAREEAIEAARRLQREAAERAAEAVRQGREPSVADLLRVGRPTPGVESPFRVPPSPRSTRGGREARARERGIERDRW